MCCKGKKKESQTSATLTVALPTAPVSDDNETGMESDGGWTQSPKKRRSKKTKGSGFRAKLPTPSDHMEITTHSADADLIRSLQNELPSLFMGRRIAFLP